MKSERRHELEKNELAVWLTNAIEQVRPYTTAILGAVLAVLIVVFAVSLWNRHAASHASGAWDAYFAALVSPDSIAELEKVAEAHAGSPVCYWATVAASDQRKARGCDQLLTNRGAAEQQLHEAINGYQAVLKGASAPMLLEQASFGLARAYEALGKLEDAGENYEKVIEQWPQGAFAASARQRLADIRSPAIQEFYRKLAKYTPKPASAGPSEPIFSLENDFFKVPGLGLPGPSLPGPKLPGPSLPNLNPPGPMLPGLNFPSPKAPGPKVPSPKAPGPKAPGPKAPGPNLSGPALKSAAGQGAAPAKESTAKPRPRRPRTPRPGAQPGGFKQAARKEVNRPTRACRFSGRSGLAAGCFLAHHLRRLQPVVTCGG